MAEGTLRLTAVAKTALADGETTCTEAVDFTSWSSGIIVVPPAYSGAGLLFLVGDGTEDTGWTALVNDTDGGPIEITVAAVPCAIALPTGLSAAPWFKIFSDNPQDGDIEFTLFLKS